MKKNLILILLMIFFLIGKTTAQELFPGQSQACTVINWVRYMLLLFVILSIVYAGYRLITGGGDPKSIQEAKTTIVIVLIGGTLIVIVGEIVTTLLKANPCSGFLT